MKKFVVNIDFVVEANSEEEAMEEIASIILDADIDHFVVNHVDEA
jgi:predicted dinucleotide-utilizing enzyme